MKLSASSSATEPNNGRILAETDPKQHQKGITMFTEVIIQPVTPNACGLKLEVGTVYEAYARLREWKDEHPGVRCEPSRWDEQSRCRTQRAEVPLEDGSIAVYELHVVPPAVEPVAL